MDQNDFGDLSVKTFLILEKEGIADLKGLEKITESDFIKIRNLGRRGTEEVINLMKQNNIKFKS